MSESQIKKLAQIRPVSGQWKGAAAELVIGRKPDRDRVSMTLPDDSHARIDFFRGFVPPWNLTRVPAQPAAQVATDWRLPNDLTP